ncbi:MAG TPA: AMP-binding protein [Methylobacter sp.]|jgi:acyl-coenzyme A synthetase/AMP-(fatty) acid ligase/3-hydroxymyristoyl/3-hydroxydecanoyl-(acyl carrier protein) dehydratase
MSDKLLPLSHCLIAQRPTDTPIAYHAGQYYSTEQFANTIKLWVDKLEAQPFQHYALYTEDAYPFSVLLFALLHAGKQIRIPGNNRPGTAEQLSPDCQLLGDWQNGERFDYCLESSAKSNRSLSPLNSLDSQLVIFTSGSTGQAKPIAKCLNQFQLEIATLEQHWGEQLGDAAALATVSHQHIYGLLFRVLWPLSAGRCFHSQAYINPETLVNAIQHGSAYWIASPAHLKRLDRQSPWDDISDLKAIFSSGGALPENAAQQIFSEGGQAVIEVYGSSETGGIAWRQQEKAWTLFAGMRLTCIDGKWLLHSPYLQTGAEGFQLDDQITMLEDGRFTLHGRSDRIVKIEEKRLSLVELEQHLITDPWIDEAHALVISNHRDVVAAVMVLNHQGLEQLAIQGRNRLIRQLRRTLEQWFESVVLPRKWLFVNAMPLTVQGKIDQQLLKNLFLVPTHRKETNRKFPQVLNLEITPDSIRLDLRVSKDLLYFPDHFASYPILPGVVQLAWVEHFGKLFFVIDKPFSHMEVVKFTQVIKPGDELTLALDWKAASGKLYFNFSSERGTHSSGRMVYGDNE